MIRCYLDTETNCHKNLRRSGSIAYARLCRILCVTWALEDEPVQLWEAHLGPPPSALLDVLHDPSVTFVAHNAMFDRNVMGYAFPHDIAVTLRDPARWECTQAMAQYLGYPGGLDLVAKSLSLDGKLGGGKEGIKLFTQADHWQPWEKPEEWAEFMEYAVVDTDVARNVHRELLRRMTREARIHWNTVELARYHLDQRINDRGLGVDLEMAAVASSLASEVKLAHDAEMTQLTNGAITKAGSDKLRPYLLDHHMVALPNLQRGTIEEYIENPDANLDDTALAILNCRRDAKYNSLSKFDSMAEMADEDPEHRARGGYKFHGAHTGRTAGQAVQPQNLSRPVDKLDPVEVAENIIRLGGDVFGEYPNSRPNDVLMSAIRGAFIPAPGNLFYVVDYSNIEARITAWFASATRRLELFERHDEWVRAGKPGKKVLDIYEFTALDVLGREDKDARQAGKTMELGLGFGMGYRKFAGINGLKLALAEEWVDGWREKNWEIRELWKAIETLCAWGGDWKGAAEALKTLPEFIASLPVSRFRISNNEDFGDGDSYTANLAAAEQQSLTVRGLARRRNAVQRLAKHLHNRGVRFRARGTAKFPEGHARGALGQLTLPGGKPIHYVHPGNPFSIEDGKPRRWLFGARSPFGHWHLMHGGLLVENLVQATARELLVHHMQVMDDHGFVIVGHSHDELIMEVPTSSAEKLQAAGDKLMEIAPKWLNGCPLRVESFLSPRYTKG